MIILTRWLEATNTKPKVNTGLLILHSAPINIRYMGTNKAVTDVDLDGGKSIFLAFLLPLRLG